MKMQNPKILIDCSILTLTLFIAMPMIANAVGSMNFLSVILLIGFPLLCLICGIPVRAGKRPAAALTGADRRAVCPFDALLFRPSASGRCGWSTP